MPSKKNKSKSHSDSQATPESLSKNVIQFSQTTKEIDFLITKIKSTEVKEKSQIVVFKSKLRSLEQRLIDISGEFTGEENEECFDKYLCYQDKILNEILELEEKQLILCNSVDIVNSKSQSINCVKLPKIELPHFHGDSSEWISFRELFSSTVLNNKQLSNVEKLQYLQSSVRGNAARLIRGFPLQGENLKHCWDLLNERYENKRHLAISQINKMFSFKTGKASHPKALLEIVDTCNESVRNLATLGLQSNELSDLMIINFMVAKLDDAIRERWELSQERDVIPTLEAFRKFIEKEAQGSGEYKQRGDFKPSVAKRSVEFGKPRSPAINSAVVSRGTKCLKCDLFHPLFKCPQFNALPLEEKWKFVESKNLCSNCLRANHRLGDCKINVNCKNCAENHHTLLHRYVARSTWEGPRLDQQSQSTSLANNAQSYSQISPVLLSTARICVTDKNGQFVACKALVDSASQHSLISQACANRLNLPSFNSTHKLIGVNGVSAETSLHVVNLHFSPHFSSELISTEALVVKTVTSPLPNFNLVEHNWPHITNLVLADPEFYRPSEIDVLLGADVFTHLINGAPIHGPFGSPTAIPSKLGYLLSGRLASKIPRQSSVSCHAVSDLSEQLHKFWQLESFPQTESISSDDKLCEDFYEETTTRNSDGRYVVRLPFNASPRFADSAKNALKRFNYLEHKLDKDPNIKSQYVDFMNEYIDLEHMQVVHSEPSPNTFYLPHHYVERADSATTKLRVVFDASAKDTNQSSLNDFLHKGPKLQPDLFEILVQFRCYPIAVIADIEKMFRQILIHDEDTDFQRIFWRPSVVEPIQTYRLLTVTYGTASAPYLAVKTLQKLARDEKNNFPEAASVVLNNFYMDDLLAGAKTEEECKRLVNDVSELLKHGGFNLRKWATNCPEILSDLPEESKSMSTNLDIGESKSLKVLGLVWNLQQDTLHVKVNDQISHYLVSTKRQLLSFTAKIFDPLGFLAPCTVLLKITMQKLWKDKLSWDDHIPSEIRSIWEKFRSQLNTLSEINAPRFILSQSDLQSIQLHGFCDSSLLAYSAVIYLRIVTQTGDVIVNFVTAKTRVAPLKPTTLPRLELCSALLLAELIGQLLKTIKLPFNKVYAWSDSMIALNWIANPPTKGNQFVTHRVEKINSLIPKDAWHHIPGKSNPADSATRGLLPEQLKHTPEWWSGPAWLLKEFHAPTLSVNLTTNAHGTNLHEDEPNNKDLLNAFSKFSSFTRLIRVLAWIFRFSTNARATQGKITGPLQAHELRQATIAIVKLLQESEFSSEIKLIAKNKPLPSNSKLIALNVFRDSAGVLRVGGRLGNQQELEPDHKNPMILPKSHDITKSIIRHFHQANLHAGQEMVLSLIRQKFWIPDGRSTVRKELRRCITCLRSSAKPKSPFMGDLPSSRITPTRPFEKTGVDFAGPINTKCQHKRKATTFKSYLCLFICMSTKAVHLELVSSLSSDAFLASLRRFIARRGYPSDIYSDNGTNFVGASSYLKEIFQMLKGEDVQNFCAPKFISWHFIPPFSPNFGGLWESSIKLAKRHLTKTCRGTMLNFEELATLLCQIEACINSRPLVPLSTDPKDCRALTPGHFLIGSPLLELPENPTNRTNQSISISSRYRKLLEMRDSFWLRWSRDYLHTLQSRQRCQQHRQSVQIGDLVLLADPSRAPLQWRLGRICQLHPGADRITRVVDVSTSTGTVRRPVNKLVLLPNCRPPEDVEEISTQHLSEP